MNSSLGGGVRHEENCTLRCRVLGVGGRRVAGWRHHWWCARWIAPSSGGRPHRLLPSGRKEIAYCSGTLISPSVFLTAAHCGFLATPEVGVTFEEKYTDTSKVYVGTFHPHPDFVLGTNSYSPFMPDVAVVVFDDPIPGIVPAQLPTVDLLGEMKAARTLGQSSLFTAVGYGDTQFVGGPGGQTTTHPQARWYAVGTYNALSSTYLFISQHLKKGEGGTCNGDSGGPNFIGGGPGETPIIAAITVRGDIYCRATNAAFRIDHPTVLSFLADYVTLP